MLLAAPTTGNLSYMAIDELTFNAMAGEHGNSDSLPCCRVLDKLSRDMSIDESEFNAMAV